MPGMSLTTIGMALGMFGGAGAAPVEYLLRDEFTTDEAAPLTSPRTCEPGPGTLVTSESSGLIAIVDGQISLTGFNGSYNDPKVYSSDSFARAAGLVLKSRLTFPTTMTSQFGFDIDQTSINLGSGHKIMIAGNR